MALSSGSLIQIGLTVGCWLFVGSVLPRLAPVVDERGLRTRRWAVDWADIARARCALGSIELSWGRRWWHRVSLVDTVHAREALAASAPPDHPIQGVLAQAKPPSRWFWMILTAVCAAPGVFFLGWTGSMWLDNREKRQDLLQSYAEYTDDLERDLRLVGGADVFRPPFGGADAASFLGPRFRWYAEGKSTVPFRADREGASLALSTRPSGCKGWSDDRCLEEVLLLLPDLSWMRELSRYGHWDTFSIGPAQVALAKRSPEDLHEPGVIPEPHGGEVATMGKARLALGARTNDLENAVRDARELARLAYSTETFWGAVAAISILQSETKLRTQLGRLEATETLPAAVRKASLEAALRVLKAYGTFFSPLAPRASRERLFRSPEFHFGRCQGLADGALGSSSWRWMLEAPTLFGRDYRPDYVALGALLEGLRAECRVPEARWAWAAAAADTREVMPVVRLKAESFLFNGLELAYGPRAGRCGPGRLGNDGK